MGRHLAISATIRSMNCCGVPLTGTAPWVARLSRIAGWAMTLFISALSLATTSAGVPAGASSPYQAVTS